MLCPRLRRRAIQVHFTLPPEAVAFQAQERQQRFALLEIEASIHCCIDSSADRMRNSSDRTILPCLRSLSVEHELGLKLALSPSFA